MFNDKYYFFGLQKVVNQFCQTCKQNNSLPQTIPPPPITIRTFYPYERLQFDLIYISSKKRKYLKENRWGFQYVLSVKCTFSKYIWLFPLKERDSSSIYQLLRFICEKEGFPEIFQSDNGSEFVAKIISTFLKSHDVKIKHGKPYHPQSQGQVENLNKTVKQHLSRILQKMSREEAAKTWPLLLPGIASIINNT
jgi:Transposase and inactivated derivatives, IS30 family